MSRIKKGMSVCVEDFWATVPLTTLRRRYSRYLPVYESQSSRVSQRKNSLVKGIEKGVEMKPGKDKEKHARAMADSLTKRRSTMNSRAAYDEEEVLRKVIEESKVEGPLTAQEISRKGKRSRDESEE